MADEWADFRVKASAPAEDPWAEFRVSIPQDVAKSGGVGLAKGLIGIGGAIGDLTDLGAKGIEAASNFVSDKLGVERYQRPEAPSALNNIPTSASLQKNVEGVTGEFYKPQTKYGEVAQTVGEFAPAAIGGGGWTCTQGAQVLAPALVSEAAGQASKGTAYEPWARAGGALLGGGAGLHAPAQHGWPRHCRGHGAWRW
jgi:hypothetical protein